MKKKKIKMDRDGYKDSIKELAKDEKNVTFDQFKKLLIMVSCGGLSNKLSDNNYKMLMKHL